MGARVEELSVALVHGAGDTAQVWRAVQSHLPTPSIAVDLLGRGRNPYDRLAHAGSVILMSECEMRYIGDALRLLVDGGHRSIEPTRDAYERYRDDLCAEVATLMWGHPSIEHSWYKAADGKVYILCPWRIVEYWQMTARVDPDDHVIH